MLISWYTMLFVFFHYFFGGQKLFECALAFARLVMKSDNVHLCMCNVLIIVRSPAWMSRSVGRVTCTPKMSSPSPMGYALEMEALT